ncbi:MAG: tRNA lysidine(34) synthetase TilS [Leptolyngbyaceae cyanobacterium SL_1_1]|nr:tRNA lysidine(34) synthetase TilS [Leptolyngbyaceae cyanobacterium RM1_1_2]NJO11052.1 tRNA lysidine(34) synthetase TilS [Leptolyngbyaceae cyanobacterium SL_1_1]
MSDWTPLHARLHQTLRSRQLLPASSSLLVAVSGGQDSLCLLRLLLDLQPKWGWSLTAAYCDHGWEADAGNAEFVTQVAERWQVPLVVKQAAVPPKGENGARQWRYQTLIAIAERQPCSSVVTGHSASDRAETVLYNLVRGSGLEGLHSLTWQRPLTPEINLIRPLLDVTRSETGEFCQAQQIQVWADATNENLAYARNRLRLKVLPYLKQHFNPRTEQTLAQTAEILAAEGACLEAIAQELYQQAIAAVSRPPDWRIHRPTLRASPIALQRRALRHLLQQIMPSQPNFRQIEKLIRLLKAPNRTQSDPLPGGVYACVSQDWIIFRQSV